MDGAANWRPTQGADPAAVAAAGGVDPNAAVPAGSDWRTQLQPEARHRIVNKMYVLSIFLPSLLPLMGILFLPPWRIHVASFTIRSIRSVYTCFPLYFI